MELFLQTLNEPIVLWSILAGSIGLILIDYFFPVDWPAYVGYGLFALFIGATAPVSPIGSIIAMPVVFLVMLILHATLFSKYLTNAPKFERKTDGASVAAGNDAAEVADTLNGGA